MVADRQVGAAGGGAPIEQQDMPSACRKRRRERGIVVEVEDVGRVDQRRDQDGRRAGPAMVAQRRAADPCGDRARLPRFAAFRRGVKRQAVERGAGQLRVILGFQPDEFEEQRQRPRRRPLLQCGIGRC